ncbi:leucyl/phenylalanyl-tRNA--protein transferase [Magnetospirillum sp. UT-4]|uniref:leucyl/phenylalanyl-tRNA--protein transferase n=1 Tax=Magnetospirillum sp. UT-4 TaxID=2681467 RepID=UPI00138306EF|nr:leucyl/phenylalanyl-tRNA--protein transferase [Magnetospirillum sp. UT-4]CAA7615220.1 Leucyl/phenylalanyl-tRNA--protein transferase [Magnetospirillum sp. UT-4]
MRPLTSDLLLKAYALGIFPMARSRTEPRLYWIDPDQRGILPLDGFHVPKSLRKVLKRGGFELRVDTAFSQVIEGCARTTRTRPDTWINDQIATLFIDLYRLGLAHSVETWQGGRLVGGLYGLALGGAFFGESMFSTETEASKVALVDLVARLKIGGYRLLDTQFVTEHLVRFGAVEIPREKYLRMLSDAIELPAAFPRQPVAWEAAL